MAKKIKVKSVKKMSNLFDAKGFYEFLIPTRIKVLISIFISFLLFFFFFNNNPFFSFDFYNYLTDKSDIFLFYVFAFSILVAFLIIVYAVVSLIFYLRSLFKEGKNA